MALIQWTPDFVLGIAQIDREHHALVALINELNDAMLEGRGQDAVERTLRQLSSYTNYHFKGEELLFEKHGYAESAAHKREHEIFVDRLHAFNTAFGEGKTSLMSVDIVAFLSDWLQNHILVSDRNYIAFLHSKGVR